MMLVQMLAKKKWKLYFILFGLIFGAYLIFMTVVLNGQQNSYQDEQFQDEDVENIHYNLASLDDILNSVLDLDFKKVVSNYRKEHEEIPETTPKVNLVIASTWRSGSTLLGEMVASHPGVYYHYEPLMSYGVKLIDPKKDETVVKKLLMDLLNCSYKDLTSYIQFAYANPDILRRNERLWKLCSGMPRFKCYMSDILDRLCSLFPVHLMKIVRARLSTVSSLLQVPDTKIIWLVRDPRATMSSRLHSVDWCTTDICMDPGILCDDLNQDYHTYKALKASQPDNIMIVRYEDFARKPKELSERVLNFIGLNFHPKVEDYLKTHLSDDVESPWSTVHDSQKRMARWTKISSWEEVVKTQYMCRNEMQLLGYRTFDSESEYTSSDAAKSSIIDKL